MASINLSGVLRDSLGAPSKFNKVRFTHNTTTGTTIAGFQEFGEIDNDGSYSFDVQYGNVQVETQDVDNKRWVNHGVFTINADTPATSLPGLLGITNPVEDPDLIVIQALVADAEAAQQGAEDAQAATEALFDNFTESVADELADISPANIDWDVEIDFNDGIQIKKGYGTIDANGNKVVDFSRASESSVINKSGVLQKLAVDEAGISSGGYGGYGYYENVALWSEDFSNAFWGKQNATIVSNATTAPDGSMTANKLVSDNIQGSRIALNAPVTSDSIGDFTSNLIHVKAAEWDYCIFFVDSVNSSPEFKGSSVKIQISTGTVVAGDASSVSLKRLNDSWLEIRLSSEIVAAGNSRKFTLVPLSSPSDDANNVTGDGVSGIYVWGAQRVASDIETPPYIKTEDLVVSHAKEIASIPCEGNMPLAGESFTIEVECDVKGIPKYAPLFSLPGNAGAISTNETSIYFVLKSVTGVAMYSGFVGGVPIGVKKHIARYDGNEIAYFRDGVKISADTFTEKPLYGDFLSSIISLGCNVDGTGQINTSIKNFKIIHRALTDSEIAARGGVK